MYYILDTTHPAYLSDIETLRVAFSGEFPRNSLSVAFNLDATRARVKVGESVRGLTSLVRASEREALFPEGEAEVMPLDPGAPEGVPMRPRAEDGVVYPVVRQKDGLTIGCVTKTRREWGAYTSSDARREYGTKESAWIARHLVAVLAEG